jgi:hypothetical protein
VTGQEATSRRVLGALYWLIVVTYATLEPWGRIDTRDFSYMGPYKFWEYNALIIFQMVVMLVLGFLLWKGTAGKRSLTWITAINTLFVTMNGFDLLHFFPDPAQPMPFLVILIEVTDSLMALAILVYAQRILAFDLRNERSDLKPAAKRKA